MSNFLFLFFSTFQLINVKLCKCSERSASFELSFEVQREIFLVKNAFFSFEN